MPGQPIRAAADPKGRVSAAYVSQSGQPVLLQKSAGPAAPWTIGSLASADPGTPVTGAVQTWVDPHDGHTYVAVLIPPPLAATIVQDTTAPATSRTGNPNLAVRLPGATPIVRSPTVLISTTGIVYLAGLDPAGDLVAYSRTGRPAPQDWTYTNISRDHLRAQGMATPAFSGELVSYVTPWNALNIAGLDANGRIQAVWWAPGLRLWRTDNISAITGAPPLTGALTAYVTPWGGVNLAGIDQSGKLSVTWWIPSFGSRWATTDLTDQTGGPQLRQDSVTSFVTPWGATNIAGTAPDGSLQVYWWAPGMADWAVASLSQEVAGGPSPDGSLSGVSTPTGEINLFGTTTAGDVIRYYWTPGAPWASENVSTQAQPR